jgi:DNA-binding response OmpR family regulator
MEKALIVEDDPDQAEILGRLLRHRNLDPILAHDGRTGLKLAAEHSPDVILLDLMLPDTDGFLVCQELRRDPRTTRTPVVMVTALDDAQHRARGFRVGANAYLIKPYDAESLYQAVELARSWRQDLDRQRVDGEIVVELDNEPAFLAEVNDFLMGLRLATPLMPEQVSQLRQALMEMGQNAIEWGNRHRSEALVQIVYRVYHDRVEIVVRDEGEGFDRGDLPHAASADDPLSHMDVREKLGLRDGGFGMMISRGMVDDLVYNEAGNQVTLVKRFRADSVHAV